MVCLRNIDVQLDYFATGIYKQGSNVDPRIVKQVRMQEMGMIIHYTQQKRRLVKQKMLVKHNRLKQREEKCEK